MLEINFSSCFYILSGPVGPGFRLRLSLTESSLLYMVENR